MFMSFVEEDVRMSESDEDPLWQDDDEVDAPRTLRQPGRRHDFLTNLLFPPDCHRRGGFLTDLC